jgi:hypothetical protein
MSHAERFHQHSLPPHGQLVLYLPAGAELHCTSGGAILAAAARMSGDALWIPTQVLREGQSWRTEHRQRISLYNQGHLPCRLTEERPAEAPSSAPEKQNRLATSVGRRLLQAGLAWLRRVPNAASMKSL